MKNHQGFIDVESESGRGTTFRLYFPILCTEHRSAVEVIAKEQVLATKPTYHRGTVLVIEDEQAMVRLLEKFLAQAGYQVVTALDGEEAIVLYERHKRQINIVLLDLNLPKAKGSEVIRRLKEHSPELKLVVASGYLEPEMKSQLLRAGVKDYIQKPYAIDDVLEKLHSLIESS